MVCDIEVLLSSKKKYHTQKSVILTPIDEVDDKPLSNRGKSANLIKASSFSGTEYCSCDYPPSNDDSTHAFGRHSPDTI